MVGARARVTWFAHVCWYCGHRSKDVNLLVSSMEYHDARDLSLYECTEAEACQARREVALDLHTSPYMKFLGFSRHGEVRSGT